MQNKPMFQCELCVYIKIHYKSFFLYPGMLSQSGTLMPRRGQRLKRNTNQVSFLISCQFDEMQYYWLLIFIFFILHSNRTEGHSSACHSKQPAIKTLQVSTEHTKSIMCLPVLLIDAMITKGGTVKESAAAPLRLIHSASYTVKIRLLIKHLAEMTGTQQIGQDANGGI